jgi:hypothetical protein
VARAAPLRRRRRLRDLAVGFHAGEARGIAEVLECDLEPYAVLFRMNEFLLYFSNARMKLQMHFLSLWEKNKPVR